MLPHRVRALWHERRRRAPYGYQKHLGRKTVYLPYEDFGAPAEIHL
jgi:hypothetical protein